MAHFSSRSLSLLGSRQKDQAKRRSASSIIAHGKGESEEEDVSVDLLSSTRVGSTQFPDDEGDMEEDIHDLSRKIEKQLLLSGRKVENKAAKERAEQQRRIALAKMRMIPSTRLDPLTDSEEDMVRFIKRFIMLPFSLIPRDGKSNPDTIGR